MRISLLVCAAAFLPVLLSVPWRHSRRANWMQVWVSWKPSIFIRNCFSSGSVSQPSSESGSTDRCQNGVGSVSAALVLKVKMQLTVKCIKAAFCFVNQDLHLLWVNFYVEWGCDTHGSGKFGANKGKHPVLLRLLFQLGHIVPIFFTTMRKINGRMCRFLPAS